MVHLKRPRSGLVKLYDLLVLDLLPGTLITFSLVYLGVVVVLRSSEETSERNPRGIHNLGILLARLNSWLAEALVKPNKHTISVPDPLKALRLPGYFRKYCYSFSH